MSVVSLRQTVATCTICSELRGAAPSYLGAEYGRLVHDCRNVIISGCRFAVVPSIGALHPSHALIVPRRHLRSIAEACDLGDAEELAAIKKVLSDTIRARGATPVFFEHGMGKEHDCSGSCIDHAHLHVIADIGHFSELAHAAARCVCIGDFAAAMIEADRDSGYALVEREDGYTSLCNRPCLPPQLFRRVYSFASDDVLNWNWRLDRRPQVTRRVVDYYSGARFFDAEATSSSFQRENG